MGGVWFAPAIGETPKKGFYAVQLNAFKNQENARRFSKKLALKGYPVYITRVPGDPFFKVRLGPFNSYQAARKTARQLKRWEGLTPFVLWTQKAPSKGKVSASSGLAPQEASPAGSGSSEPPAPSPASPPADSEFDPSVVDQVMARFLSWKSAWQAGDVPGYLSFYAASFDTSPKSVEAWKRSRQRALQLNRNIQIEVDEIKIVPEGDRVVMSFIQRYQSQRHRDVGHKTLVWQQEEGLWKIVSESWSPI